MFPERSNVVDLCVDYTLQTYFMNPGGARTSKLKLNVNTRIPTDTVKLYIRVHVSYIIYTGISRKYETYR